MRRLIPGLVVASAALAACGDPTLPVRSPSARQALTQGVDTIQAEPVAARQEMFLEVVRTSQVQAKGDRTDPVLFPMLSGGDLVAAKPLEPGADLLQVPDAGSPLPLWFEGHDPWPEDRRDSLQGLSEREAAELVARTLLSRWGVVTGQEILVDRVEGAPYAVAYVDGVVRINAAFLYMAAAVGPSSF
jgi:hypothetical protein